MVRECFIGMNYGTAGVLYSFSTQRHSTREEGNKDGYLGTLSHKFLQQHLYEERYLEEAATSSHVTPVGSRQGYGTGRGRLRSSDWHERGPEGVHQLLKDLCGSARPWIHRGDYYGLVFCHRSEFIQSDLNCIQVTVFMFLISSCFSWESNP